MAQTVDHIRTVECAKLKATLEGLDYAPYPGELGERIYNTISEKAWEMWLRHQTMLVNEYRLNSLEDKAREFLTQEMEKFLFGDGSEKPAGYTPSVSQEDDSEKPAGDTTSS